MIKRSELNRSYGWRKVEDYGTPCSGVLCIIYLPISETESGETNGSIAMAYCHGEKRNWIHATVPMMLIDFEPAYWKPFDEVSPYDARLKRELAECDAKVRIQKHLVKELETKIAERGKPIERTMPFGFYAYKNFAVDALHEKIAKQDKTLRGYEKKMSEMGETILRLRKEASKKAFDDILKKSPNVHELNKMWMDRIDSVFPPDPPTEKPKERICTECKHVVRVNATGQRCIKCNRHKNVVTREDIPCNIARGISYPEDIPYFDGFDDCGLEGKFWTPKEETITSASVGPGGIGYKSPWLRSNGGAG